MVVGVNPYNKHLMLHDGVEHILLVAPTCSGKGVNTIIPTGLVWQHSIFFFDVKEELWQATAGYRQKVLGYIYEKLSSHITLRIFGIAGRKRNTAKKSAERNLRRVRSKFATVCKNFWEQKNKKFGRCPLRNFGVYEKTGNRLGGRRR